MRDLTPEESAKVARLWVWHVGQLAWIDRVTCEAGGPDFVARITRRVSLVHGGPCWSEEFGHHVVMVNPRPDLSDDVTRDGGAQRGSHDPGDVLADGAGMRIDFAIHPCFGLCRIFLFDTSFGPIVYVQRITMGEA